MAARAHGLLQQAQVGGAAPVVDVRAVRLRGDRRHLGAEPLERLGGDAGVRAVGAVDRDPETRELAAEALEHVLEVAIGRDLDPVDGAAAGRRGVEQRLDLLLGPVGQLAPVAVEELDAVVGGRVVRSGDDHAEIEGEQRDRRSRQDSGEHGVAARGDDPARERLLELRPRAARVPPDEDASATGPQGRRLAELLDELCGQVLADDPADAVRAEVAPQERVSAC